MRLLSLPKIFMMTLVSFAVGLSVWSMLLSENFQMQASSSSLGQPDAFMEKITAIILNTTGKPSLEIQSNTMTHYAAGDITKIDQPHVLVYRESLQPWQIDALRAKASNGLNMIAFSDHVIVQHAADNKTTATTLSTEELTVFPSTQQAETDLAVTIKQPNATMQGVGMKSNLATGLIQLLSQTRGRYVPDA